ncbi:MAG: class I SAM-dependent methyltransferase [Actinomycetota bacterium]|nr:class I SAM-dependent methyltransferase [Actinomycetota bacterium]
MPGPVSPDRLDLSAPGFDRSALAAGQYRDDARFRRRTFIYDHVELDAPAPTSFADWVLDRIPWTGTETVVDVGCGNGAYLGPLARRAERVIGVDLAAGMLRSAARHSGGASLVLADAQQLPLADDRADAVVAAHMLYHVPDIRAAVTECRRLLRPGGMLLAAANGRDDKSEIVDLWTSAGTNVIGAAFEPPRWSRRFHLELGEPLMAELFDDVSVYRLPGRFRFTEPTPVIRWAETLRDGTEPLIDERSWDEVLAELERLVVAHIEAHGTFVVTKDSGVLVAR